MALEKLKFHRLVNSRSLKFPEISKEFPSDTSLHSISKLYCLFFSAFHNIRRARKNIKLSSSRKSIGATQVDFILAVSLFLIFFSLTIQYMTDYFSTVRETTTIADARSQALSLLGIADRGFYPQAWPQISNISNDLALLLHFNNDTLDYSGKGNNGTGFNGANCSASVAGRFFSGCRFDGINDFVNVTHSQSLNFSSSQGFTVAAWVYGVDNGGQAVVVAKNAASDVDYMMSLNPTSESPRFSCFFTNITDVEPRVNASSFENNTWTHFACAYNSTNFTIYKNGVFDNSVARYGSVNSTNTQLVIGARTAAGASPWNGTIDEAIIYNRSLSAGEIQELYRQTLNSIGLKTDAFRFIIIVNNTKPNLVNQSVNATAISLTDELVAFNLSGFGFTGIDYNSVAIYNSTNDQTPFMINGSNITFATNITVNTSQQFTVYFDDDSHFGEKTQAVTGVDNLTETFMPVERISVLQYEKLRQLNQSNYTFIKGTAGIEPNFHLKLADADTNATFMDFGAAVPRKGNIIALQRYVVFQNSTAGIRNGKLTMQTW